MLNELCTQENKIKKEPVRTERAPKTAKRAPTVAQCASHDTLESRVQ